MFQNIVIGFSHCGGGNGILQQGSIPIMLIIVCLCNGLCRMHKNFLIGTKKREWVTHELLLFVWLSATLGETYRVMRVPNPIATQVQEMAQNTCKLWCLIINIIGNRPHCDFRFFPSRARKANYENGLLCYTCFTPWMWVKI